MRGFGIAALVAMDTIARVSSASPREPLLGPPMPPGKGRAPVKRSRPREGTSACEDCGKTISANKRKCFACSQSPQTVPTVPTNAAPEATSEDLR